MAPNGARSGSRQDDDYKIGDRLTTNAILPIGDPKLTCPQFRISPGWVRTDMGGEEAQLSPEESAESLAKAIDRIGPELNGQFLDRYGRVGNTVGSGGGL